MVKLKKSKKKIKKAKKKKKIPDHNEHVSKMYSDTEDYFFP